MTQGDFLRMIAYTLVLIGAWRAIRYAEFGRAVAEERARVAREIHDGLAQYLFAVRRTRRCSRPAPTSAETLPRLKEAALLAQQEARFAILALSSASGTAPFDSALRRYVEILTADGALDVELDVDPSIRLAPDEQIEIFRIVQEGLANVRKHARATRADVTIGMRDDERFVTIEDDGEGFDGELSSAGQGLRNMRARAAVDRGRLLAPVDARARHRARSRAARVASVSGSGGCQHRHSRRELADRRARLLEHVRGAGLTGYVLFGADYIQYFTGFRFLSNERPVVYAESAGGESAIFVPEFEVERTRAEAAFERIESYPEYPGLEHPMLVLARVLADLGIERAIGADGDGYPGILGYQGPALSAVSGASVAPLGDVDRVDAGAQERDRDRAHPRERPLVRARPPPAAGVHAARRDRGGGEPSCRTRDDARHAGRAAARSEGSRPRTARRPATAARSASAARGRTRSRTRSSSAPATCSSPRRARRSGATTPSSSAGWSSARRPTSSGGCSSTPSPRRKPRSPRSGRGRRAPTSTARSCATSRSTTSLRYWRQHTGHGIGLRNHEAPFLDLGDPTVLEPGMVFTVEPGLYDSALGGFRHSDTVVVTEDGMEKLTDYPTRHRQPDAAARLERAVRDRLGRAVLARADDRVADLGGAVAVLEVGAVRRDVAVVGDRLRAGGAARARTCRPSR